MRMRRGVRRHQRATRERERPERTREVRRGVSFVHLVAVGEQDLKARAALGALHDANRAAEGAHVVAHQREPEPGAASDATVVGRATAKEPLKDGLSFFRGNARIPRRRR